MISAAISQGIVRYLFEKKGYSFEQIASALDLSEHEVKKVDKGKQLLSAENLYSVLKHLDMKFYEFALEAINLKHLPEQVRNNILLCQHLSDLKKKKR